MFNLNRLISLCGLLTISTVTLNINPSLADSIVHPKSQLTGIKTPKKSKSLTASYKGALEVKFTGLNNPKGEICAKLFNGANGFPDTDKSPNLTSARCSKIVKGAAKITFTDLPYGNYAVASVHDLNGDRRLNSNFLGIPQEGIGFSNNTRVVTSAPSFGDSQFFVSGAKTEIEIKLQYF